MDQRKRGRTSDSLLPAPSTFEAMPSATGGGDFGSGLAGIAKKFCLGATFPVDITKTRLQLQGQASENPVTHEPQHTEDLGRVGAGGVWTTHNTESGITEPRGAGGHTMRGRWLLILETRVSG